MRRPAALVTREALRGRRWALTLLASPRGAPVPAPPAVGAEGWRLLCDVESCGLPLTRELRAHGLEASAPPALLEAARGAAERELQRVMMARAQLRALDAHLADAGLTAIAIKGARVAEDAEPLDLGDIDLLMPSEDDARRFAAVLDARGYVTLLRDPAVIHGNHLGARFVPGGLGVELHVRATYGDELAPASAGVSLAGYRALRADPPAREVARVLRHTVRHHYFRRGHVRDVVLLARHVNACTGEERARLWERLSREPDGDAQRALLGLAEAVADRRGVADGADPFAEVSAIRYELRQRGRMLADVVFRYWHRRGVELSLRDPHSWRPTLTVALGEPIAPGSAWDLAQLRRAAPVLADALGNVLRAPYRIAAIAHARVAARGFLRRARRAVADAARA